MSSQPVCTVLKTWPSLLKGGFTQCMSPSRQAIPPLGCHWHLPSASLRTQDVFLQSAGSTFLLTQTLILTCNQPQHWDPLSQPAPQISHGPARMYIGMLWPQSAVLCYDTKPLGWVVKKVAAASFLNRSPDLEGSVSKQLLPGFLWHDLNLELCYLALQVCRSFWCFPLLHYSSHIVLLLDQPPAIWLSYMCS